jgi:hypothetical protein
MSGLIGARALIGTIALAACLLSAGALAQTSPRAQARPTPPPADQRAAPGHPGWMADARAGCWVWDAAPAAGETVTWSGACGADGRATGRGTLEWRAGSSVDRYDGEMRGGRSHGRRVYISAGGDRFEGEFRNGQAEGSGVFQGSAGELVSGVWVNGCYRGRWGRRAIGRNFYQCP